MKHLRSPHCSPKADLVTQGSGLNPIFVLQLILSLQPMALLLVESQHQLRPCEIQWLKLTAPHTSTDHAVASWPPTPTT